MSFHLIIVLVLHEKLRYIFFLLSICTYEPILAPKIMTFLPMLPSVNKNSERGSNPIPYPLYLYLSESAFLVSSTDRNVQLFNVKYVFKFLKHGLNV